MVYYILDTNFFFNLEIQSGFGDSPKQIFASVTDYARRLRKAGEAEFFMPPRIVDEILTFVSSDEEYIKDFLSEITVKAPDQSKIQFPAGVFYDIVEDIRHRSYRGLQVAEEELDNASKAMLATGEVNHIEYQKSVGEHIKRLRDRYRNATRVKFLDSLADLDVIVLAKELDGYVVSADEGVILWARKFGVKEAIPNVFKGQLDSILKDSF